MHTYQEQNEHIQYQIPNQEEEWPSQADFQLENTQPKETAKYITRNEGLPTENNTGKVQRALKYLQNESVKQPQIVHLFNKWVDDDKASKFETFAKT